MQRNTKHILNACFLLALLFLMMPMANAQLPGNITNNLQIVGYDVNGMGAPPALYTPTTTNGIEIWAKNYGASTITLAAATYVDYNNDGSYSLAEMIYSSGSGLALPPAGTNNGIGSILGTTIVMPNLPPGNYNTMIELYTSGSTMVPGGGLVRAEVGGSSSTNLTLMAVVQDDPNYNIPILPVDCPTGMLVDINGTHGGSGQSVTVQGIYSPRQIILDVLNQNNINTIEPFTLIRHIDAIDAFGVPTPLKSFYIVPPTTFFPNNLDVSPNNNKLPPNVYFDDLNFVYDPPFTLDFEVHYYLEDQNGNHILISNSNSAIGAYSAYQSWGIDICESQDLSNPDLDELADDIASGLIELSPYNSGQDGRKAFNQFQAEQLNGIIFPNPSTGMSYLQLELAEANQISWQIFNINGQQVSTRTIQSVKAGTYAIPLGTQDLAPGIYVCQYSLNGQLYQKRFAKQ